MSSDVRPYSRVSDVERLRALERLNILDTPPEPEFDGIVQLARRVCSVPVALISLVASDRQWFKARAGLDASETPINQSVCAYAWKRMNFLSSPIFRKTPEPRTIRWSVRDRKSVSTRVRCCARLRDSRSGRCAS